MPAVLIASLIAASPLTWSAPAGQKPSDAQRRHVVQRLDSRPISYIGGSGFDAGYGIAVDNAGAAYVAGATASTEGTFPVTVGPDLTYNGSTADGFVAKLAGDGPTITKVKSKTSEPGGNAKVKFTIK